MDEQQEVRKTMDSTLETLAIFNADYEANLAQSILDSEGIFSAVFKDDAGGMEPQLQLTRGVKLKVLSKDMEPAKIILGYDIEEKK